MRMSLGVEKLLPFDGLNINDFGHSELGSQWMEFHKTFTGYTVKPVLSKRSRDNQKLLA